MSFSKNSQYLVVGRFSAKGIKNVLKRVIVFKKVVFLQRKRIRGVVQLASILAWGASGRPFESGHSDE